MKHNVAVITILIPLLALSELSVKAQVPVQLPQNMIDMQQKAMAQAENMMKRQIEKSGIKTSEHDLKRFISNIKKIKINEDTKDDVIKLLGSPKSISSESGSSVLHYMFMPNYNSDLSGDIDKLHERDLNNVIVNAEIEMNNSDKVKFIKITKSSGRGDSAIIYEKGSMELPGLSASGNPAAYNDHFPLKDSAPENPTEGQIYFNKNDKHFYGWDGTSWLKLDTKP